MLHLPNFDPSRAPALIARIERELEKRRTKRKWEESLYAFFEAAWPNFDPAPFSGNWHLEAIADHLEAVTRGDIRKLLINIPPRCGKTLMLQVAWPAWTWAQRNRRPLAGPQVKFMSLTYAGDLAREMATTARRLIDSPWYQENWGDLVKIDARQDNKERFDTTEGGTRISTSFGGVALGRGADIKIIDDPIKPDEAESETIRDSVNRTYDETLRNRVTDPRHSAEVIIMQRLSEGDLSGHVLDTDPDFVHLCLPMEHERSRHCVTSIGFEDPREEEGELLWPDRFGDTELAPFKRVPYQWAGQYQQAPAPRGGGIFKREWWQLWEPPDGKWPTFDYLVASVDGAFTEKEENDPSAMTVWGVFKGEGGLNCAMLVKGWRKHLEMHGEVLEMLDDESYAQWRRRSEPSWGLVEWIAETCRFRNPQGEIIGSVDRLLIEAKASGITAAQEIQRLYGNEGWVTELVDPKGDKVARAMSVVPIFANGQVFAPDREWADVVLDEMSVFPKGRHDDLTDTATQALKHLRTLGLLQQREEVRAEDERRSRQRKRQAPLYPA